MRETRILTLNKEHEKLVAYTSTEHKGLVGVIYLRKDKLPSPLPQSLTLTIEETMVGKS